MNRKVLFYQLLHDAPQRRQALAVTLAARAYRGGEHLCIVSNDTTELRALDQRLWQASGFLPHALGEDETLCVHQEAQDTQICAEYDNESAHEDERSLRISRRASPSLEHRQQAPIILVQSHYHATQVQTLINLSDEMPAMGHACYRICEIIRSDASGLEHARVRWRNYQQQGYHCSYHKIA